MSYRMMCKTTPCIQRNILLDTRDVENVIKMCVSTYMADPLGPQISMYTRPVARGGRGGRTTPPVAHPKDFVPPFSNFVPPFSNFVPPFSNFVPPFSNFVPPLEYVDDVTRAMSKGGGVLVNVQEWGRFSN